MIFVSEFLPSQKIENSRYDWKTPKDLYLQLDKYFNFTFDPCPTNPQFDGLSIDWGEVNFVNPPYGREISKWIKKGYEEYLKGKRVIMLIPARTDTKYWHDYIMKANELWFIKGRLRFDDGDMPAPFPSVIVIFNPDSTIYDEMIVKSVDTNAKELYL